MKRQRKNLKWYKYQELICQYFISLGFEAETNKRLAGVRTHHDIDVYVRTKFMGQDLKWIVECKLWNAKVNKLQALGLRTIVDEIGADKGFIISEKGFQKGAIEAVLNTNITLITFNELKEATKGFIESELLDHFFKRMQILNNRYWAHSKSIRRKYGLRDELGENYYSISFVLATAEKAIESAKRKEYPIKLDTSLIEQYGDRSADNIQQLTNWLNLNFNIIDDKILDAEIAMQKVNEYSPKLLRRENIDFENLRKFNIDKFPNNTTKEEG